MDKIYSRPRIRIPKFRILYNNRGNRDNSKIRKTSIIIVVLTIAFTVLAIGINSIDPIFETLCIDNAKSIATLISNKEATDIMKEYEYSDIITIHKDSNGNISMLETDVIVVNKIISDVAIRIQNGLNNEEENKTEIKLGSLTGIKFISGSGPSIPIRLSSTGSVETDFKSSFTETGINQTLHRLYLDVTCTVSILTPYQTITTNIINQVILAENIIVGNIPSTYLNVDDTNSNNLFEEN